MNTPGPPIQSFLDPDPDPDPDPESDLDSAPNSASVSSPSSSLASSLDSLGAQLEKIDPKRSSFYLSYLANYDPDRGTGHASIAITEFTPSQQKPRMILKVGLFDDSQVEIEDFLSMRTKDPKLKLKVFHKTFPITYEQLEVIMKKLNEDRKLFSDYHKKDEKLFSELTLNKYYTQNVFVRAVSDIENSEIKKIYENDTILHGNIYIERVKEDLKTESSKDTLKCNIYFRGSKSKSESGTCCKKQTIEIPKSLLSEITFPTTSKDFSEIPYSNELAKFIYAYVYKQFGDTSIMVGGTNRGIQKDVLNSRPGGPKYSLFFNNCKTYALSLMKAIKLKHSKISNFFVQIPSKSGKLEEAKLTPSKDIAGVFEWESILSMSLSGKSKDKDKGMLTWELNLWRDFLFNFINYDLKELKMSITTSNSSITEKLKDLERNCKNMLDTLEEITSKKLKESPKEELKILLKKLKAQLQPCKESFDAVFSIVPKDSDEEVQKLLKGVKETLTFLDKYSILKDLKLSVSMKDSKGIQKDDKQKFL